jgi:hypothetical protein
MWCCGCVVSSDGVDVWKNAELGRRNALIIPHLKGVKRESWSGHFSLTKASCARPHARWLGAPRPNRVRTGGYSRNSSASFVNENAHTSGRPGEERRTNAT